MYGMFAHVHVGATVCSLLISFLDQVKLCKSVLRVLSFEFSVVEAIQPTAQAAILKNSEFHNTFSPSQ